MNDCYACCVETTRCSNGSAPLSCTNSETVNLLSEGDDHSYKKKKKKKKKRVAETKCVGSDEVGVGKDCNGDRGEKENQCDNDVGKGVAIKDRDGNIINGSEDSLEQQDVRLKKTARDKFRFCGNCDKPVMKKILVCAGCKKVCYCDMTCQKSHWKKHKMLCDYVRNKKELTG